MNRKTIIVQKVGFPKGTVLWRSPEAEPLAGHGTESHTERSSVMLLSALQGVNFKTVQWTVLKEGTLCKRERPLKYIYNGLCRC